MSPRSKPKVSSAYRRILWPTDFSLLAEAALPHAIKLAAENSAELVVLHVLFPVVLYPIPEVVGAAWDQLERVGKAELHRITKKLQGQVPKLRVHSVLAQGVPFDQILRAAKRLRCDLIVLATHGRTGLRHALMGSVAENVVRRAFCPVLTVRPPRFPR